MPRYSKVTALSAPLAIAVNHNAISTANSPHLPTRAHVGFPIAVSIASSAFTSATLAGSRRSFEAPAAPVRRARAPAHRAQYIGHKGLPIVHKRLDLRTTRVIVPAAHPAGRPADTAQQLP